MQVEHNGERYRLKFQHFADNGVTFRGKPYHHVTVCDVYRMGNSGVVVATGLARCGMDDVFHREDGRQIALRRAVDNLARIWTATRGREDGRVLRGKLLKAYFTRRKGRAPEAGQGVVV